MEPILATARPIWDARSPSRIYVAFALLAALAYSCVVVAFATNIPVGDDYILLARVTGMRGAASVWQWIHHLQLPLNEHRLVTERLIAWAASLWPTGLDFRHLILVGNAALLVAVAVIGLLLRAGDRAFAWPLLALILLQPQQYRLMFYSVGALQVFSGLLLSAAYFHFSIERREAPALLCLIGATATTGAGIFLVVPTTLLFFIERRHGWLVRHVLLAIGLAVWLLPGTESPGGAVLSYAWQHPSVVARFFFGLLGSVAEIPSYRFGWLSSYTTVGAGTLLLVYGGLVFKRVIATPDNEERLRDLTSLLLIIYCVVMLLLVAGIRAQIYQADILSASLDGRYRIYSCLLAAVCLIDAITQFVPYGRTGRALVAAALAGGLTFNIAWYVVRIDTIRTTTARRQQDFDRWVRNGDASRVPSWAVSTDDAVKALQEARAGRIYLPSLSAQ